MSRQLSIFILPDKLRARTCRALPVDFQLSTLVSQNARSLEVFSGIRATEREALWGELT